jgi:glycosyltransferase involved in cell wall biosynthesis
MLRDRRDDISYVHRSGEIALAGLWIVIPAYNESSVLAHTLAGLAGAGARLLVVDDGSSDATSAIAEASGAMVARHVINLGQGAALQTGIALALARGADFVCTFDADGQHEPTTVDRMHALLLGDPTVDVVLASRFLGSPLEMSYVRRLLLRTAIVVTNRQTRLSLTDTHNGLRMFRRAAAQCVRITQPGMAHGSEVLSNIASAKLRVVEVPSTVRYTEYSRRKGQRLTNSFKIAFDLIYAAWSR